MRLEYYSSDDADHYEESLKRIRRVLDDVKPTFVTRPIWGISSSRALFGWLACERMVFLAFSGILRGPSLI